MHETNYLNLDIRALNTFLVIMEKGSITASANQLNITQSAVSHGLEKLRAIFHDPLFIRSGRGITPTPRAIQLEKELKPLLKKIEALTSPAEFDPAKAELNWSIAANDFQRDLLLPAFYHHISAQVADFSLRITPSEIPTVAALREGHIDLMISPLSPDAPDILQKRLFNTRNRCFYDPNARQAPETLDDFRQSHYISLTFMEGKNLHPAEHELNTILEDNVRLRVSDFSGLAEFLRGSQLLVVVPDLLENCQLKGFASTALPYQDASMTMYMLWHQRNQLDPTHQWLREQLVESSAVLRFNQAI